MYRLLDDHSTLASNLWMIKGKSLPGIRSVAELCRALPWPIANMSPTLHSNLLIALCVILLSQTDGHRTSKAQEGR